jgi:class 3 adenylate cyclase/predicted ATPase
MLCPACGSRNRSDASFCQGCGISFLHAIACPRCRASCRSEETFCDACGHRLPQAPVTSEGFEGERKTVTALFADIHRSVALMEDLDPEDARHIVDPALELMIEAVRHYGGYVDKSTGDGILALFGAPLAYEDHALRGVYAALRMRQAIAVYGEKLRQQKALTLRVRIGLNSGEMVLRQIRRGHRQSDYTPIGHAANLAARMERLAAPGSIRVSEHTYRLTEGYVQYKQLAPKKVKGVRRPVETYEVVDVGPIRTKFDMAARRGLVRFVGRDTEIGEIVRARELADTGLGQIAAVVGEPGVGKSRLFHEFKQRATGGCTVLETFAVAYGNAYPCLPLIELLKDYCEIVRQDDEQTRRGKIAAKVAGLDPTLEDAVPYLQHLLGVSEPTTSLHNMDAQIKRQRTFDAIRRLLVRESLNHPVVFIVEDLQWIDGETQAFMNALSDSVARARILLLVNYRPEYRHAWGGRTFYRELPLDPLPTGSAYRMLTDLLGADDALQPLKYLVMHKTEGNPFFMEEIVQSLFDRGVLARVPGGFSLTGALSDVALPPTVQGVIAARIDRLPANQKALLQSLAVIGREFSFELVKHVAEQPDDELKGLLLRLQRAEFVYEYRGRPEAEYAFKHALTREVVYGSLLMEQRRTLHERVARAIEAVFHPHLDDHYAELAHHYSRSGSAAKAVEYLRLASRQAVQRSANAEAITHLHVALQLLETLPEGPERARQELAVQVALGAPLALTRGYADPEVGRTRRRAHELCRQVDDTPQLFPVVFGLWAFSLVHGELSTALELGEQLGGLAQSLNQPALRVEVHRAMGPTLFFLGELLQARAHLEEGIALYDRERHRNDAFLFGQDPGVSCLTYAALVLWHLGYPEQALRASGRAVALAREIAHPFSLAFALDMAASVHQFRGEPRLAQERAEEAIALSNEQGFALWSRYGNVLRGWAMVHQERRAAEIAEMRAGLDAWRATGARVAGPYLLALFADAYAVVGEIDEGLTLLRDSLAAAEASGECWWSAEAHRLTGELLLTSGAGSAAEASFHRAIETARRYQAKSLELRATTSLCRLLVARGEHGLAERTLTPVHRSFTEGFDTGDLRAAAQILNELA